MAIAVIVVMGVSGAGKSTIARTLAEQLGWDFAEGDDLHPAANVTKMASGEALSDEDRWPWLARVAGWIDDEIEARRHGVITCSALKRAYRDVLRRPEVMFVYLSVPRRELERRLALRHGHYMPASLLESQLAALEPPEPDEAAVTIAGDGDPREALQVVRDAVS